MKHNNFELKNSIVLQTAKEKSTKNKIRRLCLFVQDIFKSRKLHLGEETLVPTETSFIDIELPCTLDSMLEIIHIVRMHLMNPSRYVFHSFYYIWNIPCWPNFSLVIYWEGKETKMTRFDGTYYK